MRLGFHQPPTELRQFAVGVTAGSSWGEETKSQREGCATVEVKLRKIELCRMPTKLNKKSPPRGRGELHEES